jgi:hydroxyacylglutathione hydrolase
MDRVITIPALGDNFIYLYQYGDGRALAVDPGESSRVLRVLRERRLKLGMILVTHHHGDHTAGVAGLKRKTGCAIAGPVARHSAGLDHPLSDGQVLNAGEARIQVIGTPGHTRAAVCYYARGSEAGQAGILFTGDTMFVAGCGRIFECDAAAMWESLQTLARLPDDTLVYPGHDYTVENLEFALTIEPQNQAVGDRLRQIRETIAAGGYTVPSTISQEKLTNPFLRADSPEIRGALKMPDDPAARVFAELRRRKDFF